MVRCVGVGERLDLVLWETCHIYAMCQAYRAEADSQRDVWPESMSSVIESRYGSPSWFEILIRISAALRF